MWTGDEFLVVPAGGTFIRGRSTGPRVRRAPPRARASRAHRRARRANARGRDDRASVAGSRSARARAEGGRESARSRRGKKGFERATRRRRIEARDLTRGGGALRHATTARIDRSIAERRGTGDGRKRGTRDAMTGKENDTPKTEKVRASRPPSNPPPRRDPSRARRGRTLDPSALPANASVALLFVLSRTNN